MENLKIKKIFYSTFLLIFLTFFLLSGTLMSQSRNRIFGETKKDIDTTQVILLDNFEDEAWLIKTSPANPISSSDAKLVDGAPKDIQYVFSQKSLGVKFKFIYPSVRNKVDIIPPSTRTVTLYQGEFDEMGQQKAIYRPGIRITGIAKKLGIWALSRGCECTLHVQLEDWKGILHSLEMGSLYFVGWRPLIVDVPRNIPQVLDSLPQQKPLIIRKLFIRMKGTSIPKQEYVFLDALRAYVETHSSIFDSETLEVFFDQEDQKDILKDRDTVLNSIRSAIQAPATNINRGGNTPTPGN